MLHLSISSAVSCLDSISQVEEKTPFESFSCECDWYKYRYMVILLFATITRRLSMQDGVWLRTLKSVNENKMKPDKENAKAK